MRIYGGRRPGNLPLLRAAMTATAAVVLALIAHLAGGMSAPNSAVIVLAALGLTGPTAVLLRREPRLPVLLAALTVTEVGLHALFCAAGHDTGAAAMLLCGPGHRMAFLQGVRMPGDNRMLAAHVLGTVALAAWVRRCERRVWDLACVATQRLRSWHRPARLLRPVTPPHRPTAPAHRTVTTTHPVLAGIARRGPPRSAVSPLTAP